MFCGQTIDTQSVAKVTTILKVHWAWLPLLSVVEHVTTFVPSGNVLPEGGAQVAVSPVSQLSGTVASG
jgi:hypothetical protein